MHRAALTIELDETTADSLGHLTSLWGVPAQEAVSRAVRMTAQTLAPPPTGDHWIAIFRQLQQTAGMTAERAAQWKDAIHDARR